jgi:hypothetical protein
MAPLRWLEAGRLLAIALAWIFVGSRAHAQESAPLDLQWLAPPEQCPEEGAVRALVDQHLAQTGTRNLRTRVIAVAQVEGLDDRWQARLRLRGAVAGERTIEAGSCDELAEIVSLVIALALQSHAAPPTVENSEPPQEEEPPPPAAPSSLAPEADQIHRPSPPAAGASKSARFSLGVSTLADSAALSRVAFGVAAAGLLEWRALHALLGAGYFPPVRTPVPGYATAEAVFDLAIGRLQGCFAPHLGPVKAGPCLALESGLLRGRSEGVQQPETTATFWAAAETGGGASVVAGPCIVRAEAGALWPLRRPRFVVDGDNEAHEVARVGWRALLGVFVPL